MNKQISENRSQVKWSNREKLGRLIWASVGPLFRYSPRLLWGWRVALLRIFGANIGKHVHIYPSVKIAIPWNVTIGDFSAIGDGVRLYSLGCIDIGASVTISQQAHLCAGSHDYSCPTMPLLKLPISIGDNSWLCADSYIGPSVTIGMGVVVGARAVVVRSLQDNVIAVGNPARVVNVGKPGG